MPRAFCESVLRHGRLLLSVSHMKSLQKRSFKSHAGSFGRQKHEGTRRALQTVIESTNFAACGEAIGGMRTIPHPIFVLSPTDRSEAHTSELQSLMRISYAVFCLNKKKNNHPNETSSQQLY